MQTRICEKFSEIGFTKLFLYMKKFKKSAVGRVVLLTQSDGVIKPENKDLSAQIVVFYLPGTHLNSESKIVLFGLRNGYWKDKPTRL